MRITNGMMTNRYGRNLNNSLSKLNYYNNRATTLRKFETASEDPVSASKAYILRRSYFNNDEYINNVKDIDNLMLSAESARMNINKIAQEIGNSDIIQAINGTMGKEDRTIIATKIAKLQEAMLSNANAKYGEKYIFSGGDTDIKPFTLSKEGKLLYKGIDVDTGIHVGNQGASAIAKNADGNSVIDFGKDNGNILNGFTINFSAGATTSVSGNVITLDPANCATTEDLQAQLKTIEGNLPKGFNSKLVSIPDGTTAFADGDSFKVDGGAMPENKFATVNVGGSNITFGSGNGDLLNGYTINISEGALGTSTVDNDQKVINVFVPAGTTRAGLQEELRSLSTPPLPDGVNASIFEVAGDSSVVVNFGTGEIAGGEKSIPTGTVFNLDALANESRYIDIGLGLNFDANGHLNTQSAFNISMPGIKMLGFGVNDKGMPNNMYSLLTKIKDDLSSDDYSFEALSPYIDAFSEQSTQLLYTITNSGAETNFIDFTTVRLEDSKINLTKKIKDVEYIEPAEAIMDFKAQEFSYMAALQMGTKILQPSLLDFMR